VDARKQRIRWATIARFACAGLAFVAAVQPGLGQAQTADQPSPAPITVVDPAAVPFSSADLVNALLARLTPEGEAGPPRVQVAPADAGAVDVQVGDRSRRVALGERNGPAAARVVALVIAELMSSGPGAESDEEKDDAAAVPVSPVVTVSAPPAPVAANPSRPPPRLYVTSGVAKGVGSEELLAGTVDADLAISVESSRWRLAPSVGLVYSPTRNAGTWGEVSYASAAARVLAGRSFGVVDLFGGPFVAGYSIGGATQHAGVLFGAEALARVAIPLSQRTRLIFATRAHAYGNRVRVLFADGGAYSTPRLELTIGVGLAWDWTS
jgi:hypothetical protein